MAVILKKEVSAYFGTPFGLIFIGIFLILSGVMFTIYNLLGQNASMAGMFDLLKNFTVIFFPVLVMKMFAEERERGTEKFLMTSGIRSWQIVLGKYLAACLIFAVALGITLIYVGIIARYGMLNIGAIAASYLGFYLLGISMIAVCMFVASFTENQVSAAVLAFGILFLMVILLSFTKSLQIPVISPVLSVLAITKRYDSFVMGVVAPGPVLYYLGVSVVCVAMTVENIELRRFK